MGKTYVGVGSKAQEVKKIYVGVNGIARQVKKAYVGVNGIARLIYSAEPDRFYIYHEGDECTSITGGWYSSDNRVTKNNNKISIISGNDSRLIYINTKNKGINIDEFTNVYFEFSVEDSSYTSRKISLGVSSTVYINIYNNTIIKERTIIQKTIPDEMKEKAKLSNNTLGIIVSSGFQINCNIYNIWLE